MTEDGLIDIVGLCFWLIIIFLVKRFVVLSATDETTLNLLKVIEDKDIAIKELSNQLTGYYTCTRVLLERINSNLVESQISGVDDNFGSYEIKIGKLVRRIDLLEFNLNQYFKWFVPVVKNVIKYW